MAKLKALLFDVDGTLADTEEGHRVAFNKAFTDAGLDWHWPVDLYAELLAITGGKERISHYLQNYLPSFIPASGISLAAFIAQLHRAKTQYFAQMLATGSIPLRPGVKRVLEEARSQEITLAIVTTTSPENVYALLEHSLAPTARDWFALIAAGDIVAKKKPAPDIYQYALDSLGLRPEECLAFEDSYNGLRSAHQAGIATLITVNDYTRAHDFTDALIVLDHLGASDRVFTNLTCDSAEKGMVDLAMLRRLHAHHHEQKHYAAPRMGV